MRAAVVFVTDINFRLMIRECLLRAPQQKASTDWHADAQALTYAHENTQTQWGIWQMHGINLMEFVNYTLKASFGQQPLYDTEQPL